MNQLEFIKTYCKKSNITPDDLMKFNQVAVPCACGEKDCKGWCMINKSDLKIHVDLYVNL